MFSKLTRSRSRSKTFSSPSSKKKKVWGLKSEVWSQDRGDFTLCLRLQTSDSRLQTLDFDAKNHRTGAQRVDADTARPVDAGARARAAAHTFVVDGRGHLARRHRPARSR